jgi:hypothetical protein
LTPYGNTNNHFDYDRFAVWYTGIDLPRPNTNSPEQQAITATMVWADRALNPNVERPQWSVAKQCFVDRFGPITPPGDTLYDFEHDAWYCQTGWITIPSTFTPREQHRRYRAAGRWQKNSEGHYDRVGGFIVGVLAFVIGFGISAYHGTPWGVLIGLLVGGYFFGYGCYRGWVHQRFPKYYLATQAAHYAKDAAWLHSKLP